MTRIAKLLVAAELLICFGPVVVLLTLGILVLQMSLVNPAHALSNPPGWLGMFVGVILGLIGLAAIVPAVFFQEPPRMPRPIIFTLAGLGMVSLLPLVVGAVDFYWWRIIGLLPMVATVHMFYLAREYLFVARTPE